MKENEKRQLNWKPARLILIFRMYSLNNKTETANRDTEANLSIKSYHPSEENLSAHLVKNLTVIKNSQLQTTTRHIHVVQQWHDRYLKLSPPIVFTQALVMYYVCMMMTMNKTSQG